VGVLCLAAPERADAFGSRSLELLGQLIPHLERATRVTLKMANLDALRAASFAALDHLKEGVLLTDANARVVFANRVAEAMLARADGIVTEIGSRASARWDRMSAWLSSATAAIASRPRSSSTRSGSISASP
jgi:PAS domain-containing protein